VPINFGADGRAAYVDVSLGTVPVRMLIDTGATNVSVTRSIAATLSANNEAVLLPITADIAIADGATIQAQIISIRALTIGRHTLRHVIAGVTPDGADMLLGFPVLNQAGRFTIDTKNRLLIFD
jgi:clan AA aspartic protease (TIGR02281 family)